MKYFRIKKRILMIGLVIMSGILTIKLDSFSPVFLTGVMPGFLFGLAISCSHKSNNKSIVYTAISMIFIWILMLGISMGFQFTTTYYSDKSGLIVTGLTGGFLTIVSYHARFQIKGKWLSYAFIILLSIAALLISDYQYLTPHEKELNLGVMIFYWEIFVGTGLAILTDFEGKNTIHDPMLHST